MEKQYVVRLDKRDGKSPETVFGPACLRDCTCFVQGWWNGFKVEELILAPELCLWRIFIEEVEA